MDWPRYVTATPAALPIVSSSGGIPFNVCVVPAAPICMKIGAPLPSFTSTHDFSLKVRRSVASETAADDGAASLFSICAGAVSTFAASSGFGSGVDDCAAFADDGCVAGAGACAAPTAALSLDGRRNAPGLSLNS